MKVVKANLRNSFLEKASRNGGRLSAVFTGRWPRYSSIRSIWPIMSEEKGRTVLTVKGFEEHYAKVHGRDRSL